MSTITTAPLSNLTHSQREELCVSAEQTRGQPPLLPAQHGSPPLLPLPRRHHSILDYLHRKGFANAYEALRVDADLPDFSPASANAKIQGLLEKKWTGTVRLQKKVSRSLRKQSAS